MTSGGQRLKLLQDRGVPIPFYTDNTSRRRAFHQGMNYAFSQLGYRSFIDALEVAVCVNLTTWMHSCGAQVT